MAHRTIFQVAAASYPHHVTKRGNRRHEIFFCLEAPDSQAPRKVAGPGAPEIKSG